MAFEDKTPELLHASMLENIDSTIDKREGSVSHDLTFPSAIEIGNAYVELDTVLGLGFADTSEGIYLDYICTPFGVIRKPSLKATGQVTFYGDDSMMIPINTRVQTTLGESVFFMTTEEATIVNGQVTIPVTAEIGGVSGNVSIGEINALAPSDLYGVVKVTNELAFSGGVDEESDESLLARLKYKAQNPSTSGNANHYKQWAMETIGIGDAKVFPVWNGGNTVKVVLLDDNKRCPSDDILNDATTHIMGQKPIGADVTIIGAKEVALNFSATLTMKDGCTVDQAIEEYTQLVTDYLKELAFVDPIVRYAKLSSLLIDVTCIVDYQNLTINGGAVNISMEDDQVAIIGVVNFT